MQGILFNIQRFSLHDGPGIRTSVFFKGCPLSCLWCHNPEGLARRPQLGYSPDRCIGCGACVAACPLGLHAMRDGAHLFTRSGCAGCLRCAEACPSGALESIGRAYTVEEVLEVVRRDRAFYEQSGGGMTLTGGEPMAQPAFARALAAAGRAEGISVCVETSGRAAREDLLAIAREAELFLYDIKETDPARHLAYTGGELGPLLDNLRALDEAGARVILRCPIIPEHNDREAHIDAVAALANGLRHVEGIELEPYHPLGLSKAERMGMACPPLPVSSLPGEALTPFVERMRKRTGVPVRGDR